MSRRLYLDRAPAERRGVVLLNGRPEHLLIDRDGAPRSARLAARHVARVARIERSLASAFLDLGGGLEALLALSGEARSVAEGAIIEVSITAEARRGKLALARLEGGAEGVPGLLTEAPNLIDQLEALAPGAAVIEGAEAREAADEAEAAILSAEHALPGGGGLAIEPTRALIAIDVDLGARAGEARRIARQVNRQALVESARLLRLKGLSGLVVIDLVGEGHDGAALTEVAREAFAADQPGVAFGPISRFGTFQLSIPHRRRPVLEQLAGASGAASTETVALRLLRALEREGRADGGARLVADCAEPVAAAALAHAEALSARIGARFSIRGDPGRSLEHYDVSRL